MLFGAMGFIWGIPYLLIKVAVEDISPAVIVFGRTALAAALLAPIAIRAGAFRSVRAHWQLIVAFALLEMAGPWILLTNAEKELPSGLTGLLVACVPLVGAVAAWFLGDPSALRPLRLAGIAVGLGGVALLVGGDLGGDGPIPWFAVVSVLVVCVGYATAPFLAARRLSGVPTLGVITASLALVAVLYAPWAWLERPEQVPPADALASLVALAVVCTAIAFLVFFGLIAEIGPARATFITFVNPAVAVLAGALVLDEAITAVTVGGFALVIAGCWMATRSDPGAVDPAVLASAGETAR